MGLLHSGDTHPLLGKVIFPPTPCPFLFLTNTAPSLTLIVVVGAYIHPSRGVQSMPWDKYMVPSPPLLFAYSLVLALIPLGNKPARCL